MIRGSVMFPYHVACPKCNHAFHSIPGCDMSPPSIPAKTQVDGDDDVHVEYADDSPPPDDSQDPNTAIVDGPEASRLVLLQHCSM